MSVFYLSSLLRIYIQHSTIQSHILQLLSLHLDRKLPSSAIHKTMTRALEFIKNTFLASANFYDPLDICVTHFAYELKHSDVIYYSSWPKSFIAIQ
jgi:hypothetical protein